MAMKFDPARLDRLNDPARTRYLDVDLMWQGFGVGQPRAVVDLGAGTGFFAVRFAALLPPGGRVHACDSSQFMVDWMKANLSASQLEAVAPTLVGESVIDLPGGSIDLLYMINVFHELEDPMRLLAEARRLLRPKAPVAIVDWKKEETVFDGRSHGPPIARRAEPAAARAALEAAGFAHIRQLDSLPLHFFLVGRAG
jgi:ubiquinone/menaquinone biosynthesis C-methylase UbiE